jgi:hypothetical protein
MGVLVLAGVLCIALVSGVVGEVLAIVLIGGGLTGSLLLVFLEIGLEEERDLESEHRARQETERKKLSLRARAGLPRRPRRPQ